MKEIAIKNWTLKVTYKECGQKRCKTMKINKILADVKDPYFTIRMVSLIEATGYTPPCLMPKKKLNFICNVKEADFTAATVVLSKKDYKRQGRSSNYIKGVAKKLYRGHALTKDMVGIYY